MTDKVKEPVEHDLDLACRECLYWALTKYHFIKEGGFPVGANGYCKKRAPTGVYNKERGCVDPLWPVTTDSDFCGDFKEGGEGW